MTSNSRQSCFVTCAPGLEPVVAAELRGLGFSPLRPEPGGVELQADRNHLYRANLWLRTATRVQVHIAQFPAQAFYELERQARKIPFERFLAPGQPVRLSVSCHKSRLYHSGAVAERVLEAIERRVKRLGKAEVESGHEEEADEGSGAQRFVVRIIKDRCTISADSSGEQLHRRGYRQAVSQAPLRETVAAAMLLALGYDGSTALLDPMCGSGTIVLEAGLIARKLAPGLRRSFAFERWPDHDPALWAQLKEKALQAALPAAKVPLVGSDHARASIAAALSNAERAGLSGDVRFEVKELSELADPGGPGGPGLLATNAPYGIRVGEKEQLDGLYGKLGELFRHRLPGWKLGVLLADRKLEKALGVPVREKFETKSGGVRVRLVESVPLPAPKAGP